MTTLRPLLLALLALLALAAVAPGRGQPASATFRPALLNSFSAAYTSSASGGLTRGDQAAGDVALTRFTFSTAGRLPLGAGLRGTAGLAYERTTLDAAAGTALPGSVQEVSLALGLQGSWTPAWAWGAFLRPGFYGDFQQLDGDSFNAPLFLAAFYTPRPGLTWVFGLSANAFNDQPVLPAAGVRWQLAPAWELEVGFPRTGVTYRVDPGLAWQAGLSVVGGNYRITDSLGVPAPGIARLANTYLGLTEVRVGGGLTAAFAGGLGLELSAGVTILRRFDYPDRHYRLSGDGVGWIRLALDRRF